MASQNQPVGGEPGLVVLGAPVVEVRDMGVRPEVVGFVVLARQAQQRLVLEDEVTEAVEDRLAFVDLDAAQHVRAVAGEDVGAGIHHGAGERHQELRRHEAIDVRPRARGW